MAFEDGMSRKVIFKRLFIFFLLVHGCVSAPFHKSGKWRATAQPLSREKARE
jgi:hypothetical protein